MLVEIERPDGTRETFIGVSDFTAGDGYIDLFWPAGAPLEQEQREEGSLVKAASSCLHNVQGMIEVIADTDNVTVVLSDGFLHFGHTVIHDAVDELRQRGDERELAGVEIID